MPGTVLSASHVSSHLILTTIYEVDTGITHGRDQETVWGLELVSDPTGSKYQGRRDWNLQSDSKVSTVTQNPRYCHFPLGTVSLA